MLFQEFKELAQIHVIVIPQAIITMGLKLQVLKSLKEAQIINASFCFYSLHMFAWNVLPVGISDNTPELLTVFSGSLHTDHPRFSCQAEASQV